MTVDYRTGDVLDQIRQLPDASVDLVATSPPFLALRDYNGQPGQWGSEPDPASFLDHLLELTTELRRVLAPHGSIAIEIGDSYSGGNAMGTDARDELAGKPTKYAGRGIGVTASKAGPGWPAPKSLCGTPTLFAWSLAYGRNLLRPDHTIAPWLVRNVIVWARANPPVGALGDKVRPATSYITVACPSPRRWFDLDAVRAPAVTGDRVMWQSAGLVGLGEKRDEGGGGKFMANNPAGAPPLDHWHDEPDGDLLWLINTQGSSLAHYAMWPPRLVERLILSMCPAQVCRTCGEPRRRLVEREPSPVAPEQRHQRTRTDAGRLGYVNTDARRRATTLGWSECPCADYRPGHVLDTFAGSGTTLAVADILGRDATGVDLDPANPALYQARYQQCWQALRPDAGPSPITEAGQQLGLAL